MDRNADSFERLGLPRRFAIDAPELERNYLVRSREVHPDFDTGNEDAAAALNEAYSTLREPFRRAEHLLTLSGGPSASEDKTLPPAFLMEMLDLREEIESARGSPERVERIEAGLTERTKALETAMAKLFESNELPAIRQQLNCVRYLANLLRDLQS